MPDLLSLHLRSNQTPGGFVYTLQFEKAVPDYPRLSVLERKRALNRAQWGKVILLWPNFHWSLGGWIKGEYCVRSSKDLSCIPADRERNTFLRKLETVEAHKELAKPKIYPRQGG